MRYDLVIFDNDGVLVDSEPISNKLLAGYLTELGHPTSYEDSLRDYMGGASIAYTIWCGSGVGSGSPWTSTRSFTRGCSPPSSVN